MTATNESIVRLLSSSYDRDTWRSRRCGSQRCDGIFTSLTSKTDRTVTIRRVTSHSTRATRQTESNWTTRYSHTNTHQHDRINHQVICTTYCPCSHHSICLSIDQHSCRKRRDCLAPSFRCKCRKHHKDSDCKCCSLDHIGRTTVRVRRSVPWNSDEHLPSRV